MTSTELVKTEIRRFLHSAEPEVLCVTGDWGVGKTFTWQTILDDARVRKSIALTRYSYASLFGINNLEGLKLALFENLKFLDSPPKTALEHGVHGAKSLAALAKKLSGAVSALPYIGDFLSKAGPLYFSLIRDQVICIDDLERRGIGLNVKDVFGLISFLREQRSCKVVLLLNADALEGEKLEFDKYFEKVVDAQLIFSPTAAEAAEIALTSKDKLTELLRIDSENLGISNIRVIKKVERLGRQIEPLLRRFAPEVMKSAVHSITLFGWSKFQPSLAPPLEYIGASSMGRFIAREQGKKATPEELKWDAILENYQFTHLDDLDRELLKFVDGGILDSSAVETRAEELDRQLALQKEAGSYEQAWRPFHDSFEDDVDEVKRAILQGLKANVRVASLSGLSESVKLLKEIGGKKDARELLEFFDTHRNDDEFWDTSRDRFREGPYDSDVEARIASHRAKAAAAEVFVPEAQLIRAAETYDSETIKRLAEVSIDEYYRMVKSKSGAAMRKVIQAGLNYRRIGNASPEMREVVRRMEEALKRIGSESKLNAIRIQRYGISVEKKD
jgi:hypothetical protein